jgi:hypothetical protein
VTRLLVVADRERAFLPVGDGSHPLRRNTHEHEVVAHRVGPPFAEREVVLASVAFVAVPLNQHLNRRVLLQPGGVSRQRLAILRLDVPAVGVEERVLEVAARVQNREILRQLLLDLL